MLNNVFSGKAFRKYLAMLCASSIILTGAGAMAVTGVYAAETAPAASGLELEEKEEENIAEQEADDLIPGEDKEEESVTLLESVGTQTDAEQVEENETDPQKDGDVGEVPEEDGNAEKIPEQVEENKAEDKAAEIKEGGLAGENNAPEMNGSGIDGQDGAEPQTEITPAEDGAVVEDAPSDMTVEEKAAEDTVEVPVVNAPGEENADAAGLPMTRALLAKKKPTVEEPLLEEEAAVTVKAKKPDDDSVSADGEYEPETDYTVSKKWVGEDGSETAWPSNTSVVIRLLADGTQVDSCTLDKDTTSHTFTVPVFAADGQAIKYTAEEVSSDSYVMDSVTSVPTSYELTTPSIKKMPSCRNTDFTLGTKYDLGFVIAKLTGNQGDDRFIIWTPRPITAAEQQMIDDYAAEEVHANFKGKQREYVTGVPYHYNDGAVAIGMDGNKVYLKFAKTKVWSMFWYGKFSAEYNPGSTSFVNKYRAKGSVDISVKKVLEGRDLKANEFLFELYDGNTMLSSARNDAEGNVRFNTIAFTEADLGSNGTAAKTYTIRERKGTDTSITYDESVHRVEVDLTDNGDGTISAEVASTSDVTFTNKYAPKGEITFGGMKKVTGRRPKDKEFKFELKDADGKSLGIVQNDADGHYAFTTIEYGPDDIGADGKAEKVYTISEVKGSDANITYDEKVYKITVTLTLKDDTIVAESDIPAGACDFSNIYTPKGSVTFKGVKTLEGRDLKEGEFSFALYDENGEVIEKTSNAADGSYSFSTINYTKDDLKTGSDGFFTETVKKYRIAEIKGDAPGITYDETEYNITVTLQDDGEGNITVTPDPEAESYDFNNSYEPGALRVIKSVTVDHEDTDTTKADGTYTFNITGPENYSNSISLRIRNGEEQTAIIEDLLPGQYTVEEVTPTNGTRIVGYQSVEVTVFAGTTGETTKADAHFVNNYGSTTESTVQKVWADNDDQDGIRPKSITVKFSDGTEEILNDGNKWTATRTDLPLYDENGEEITYSWTEPEVPADYVLTTEVNGTVTVLTNTHTPFTTTATVRKNWYDDNNRDGRRPNSLSVVFKADGKTIDTVTLNEGNGWEVTKKDLPKNSGGKEIKYTWEEQLPEGSRYRQTGTTVNGTTTIFSNTYVPEPTPDPDPDPDPEPGPGPGPSTTTVTVVPQVLGAVREPAVIAVPVPEGEVLGATRASATGDNSGIYTYAAIAAISSAAIILMLIAVRRKRRSM